MDFIKIFVTIMLDYLSSKTVTILGSMVNIIAAAYVIIKKAREYSL